MKLEKYVVPVETGPCACDCQDYVVRASSVQHAIFVTKKKLDKFHRDRALIVEANVRRLKDIPKWTVDDTINKLAQVINGKGKLRDASKDQMVTQVLDANISELQDILEDLYRVKKDQELA
jgi:uncharacterized cysteine cluster protein YcgN (CxxCxxCC family)